MTKGREKKIKKETSVSNTYGMKTPARNSLRRINLTVWTTTLLICTLFISIMLSSRFSVPVQLSRSEQLDYVQQQEDGIKKFCEYLTDPSDPSCVVASLKLLISLDNNPEFRQELISSLPMQEENICLVSYALCLLGDKAGLEQFHSIIAHTKFNSNEWCKRNFFSSENFKMNPFASESYGDDDVVWAIQVFEDTLEHSFAGEGWEEKRKNLLAWWKENKDLDFVTWQKAFLVSDDAKTRSSAFRVIDRIKLEHPELKSDLIQAMENESCESLKYFMSEALFSQGIKEALPIFDKYVRTATSPTDIGIILASVSLHVKLPMEFRDADRWQNGRRGDEKPFKIFINWWKLNYDFLKYNGVVWLAEFQEAEDNPMKALDPNCPKTPRKSKQPQATISPQKTKIIIEKGPFD